MEGKCEGCSGLGVVYECFCIDPHVLLCIHCVDSHLDREGSHRIKKIKVEKKDSSASQGNAVLCSICKCAESSVFCCCVYPVVELCERCQDLHISKGSAYIHPIYSISEKGKVNDLEVCEKVKVKAMNRLLAIDRINQNFHYIDTCQEAINSYFETLSQSLEKLKVSKLAALQGIRDLLKKEVEQAMKETNTLDLYFHPTLPLSLLIWNFQVSSSPSDFTLFTYQLPPSTGDLLKTLEHSISIQLKGKQDDCTSDIHKFLSDSISNAKNDPKLIEEACDAYFQAIQTTEKSTSYQNLEKLNLAFKGDFDKAQNDLLLSYLYEKHCAIELFKVSKQRIIQSLSNTPLHEKCKLLEQLQSRESIETMCQCAVLAKELFFQEITQWLSEQIASGTEALSLQHQSEIIRLQNNSSQDEIRTLKQSCSLLEKESSALKHETETLRSSQNASSSAVPSNQTIPQLQNMFQSLVTDLRTMAIKPTELFSRCGYTSMPRSQVSVPTKFFACLENEAVFVFSLEQKSWKTVNLSRKVPNDESTSCCLIGTDTLFCCGGLNSNKANLIQIPSGKVTRLPNMTEARGLPGTVSCKGDIYTFGGLQDGTRLLASAECYSTAEKRWNNIAPMSMARGCFTPCQYLEIVLLIGGTGCDYAIEAYSTINQTYHVLPLMASGMSSFVGIRDETVVFSLGTRMYSWNPKGAMQFRVQEIHVDLVLARWALVHGNTVMVFDPRQRAYIEIQLN